MIHVVMRLLSLILVVAALMMMGGDVITSLEKGGEISVRSLEQLWQLFDKHSAEAFSAWIAKDLPGFLAHGIESAMALPAWAVTGVPGVVLAFLFGRRLG